MNTIRGEKPKRFILGTYVNQSQRTTWDQPEPKKVEYFVQDQYENNYIRKVGNRYTNIYEIFDFSEDEKTELLAFNGTTQNYYQCFDTDIDGATAYKIVYCDVYFMPYKYYPKPHILVILTDRDVTDEPNNSYIASSRSEDEGWISPNGTDQYAGVAYTQTPLATYSIWVNIPDFSSNRSVLNANRYDIDNGQYISDAIYITTSGTIKALVKDSGSYQWLESSIISTGWHHIAVTYKDTSTQEQKLYVDAVLEDSTNWTYQRTNETIEYLFIARKQNNGLWLADYGNSLIRKIAIFDNVKNLSEIQSIYNNGITLTDSNLQIYYECNEQSGDLIDLSGNSRDATVENTNSSFYNPSYTWNIDNSVTIGIPNPRFVYDDGVTVHDYSFNSLNKMPTREIFYKIKNKIDWEDESITGRLHRRYVYDSTGNIVQDIEFVIEKHNLDRDEYDLLKKFDGADGMEIYPISADSDYYLSTCSMTGS